MAGPNPPRRHHYLPEFYTKRWADPAGEMCRFERKPNGELECRRKSPKSIGFARDLYKLSGLEGAEAQEIESVFLSTVDDKASRVLDRMIAQEEITDSESRSRWTRCLLALVHRSPRNMIAAQEAYRLIMSKPDSSGSVDEEECQNVTVESLVSRVDNPFIGRVINNMRWDVLDVSSANRSLLTSDPPLIMSNGLIPPEGNYALPLSPDRLFVASWGGPIRENFLSLTPTKIVALSNRIVVERADRFVIGKDRSQTPFIAKHLSKARVSTPLESVVLAYTDQLESR